MTTRPTVDQIQRVLDVINAGLEVDEAIESIWLDDEQPEPPVKPATKPVTMLTEFPDGIVIGWSHCTVLNGGCGKVVSVCACKGGPREPKVFAKWRDDATTMPAYGKSAPAQSVSTATTPVVGVGDMPGRPSSDDMPVTPANSVPCREGKHFAPIAEADRNDDGTYTCFTCQESGAQVQRD